MKLRDLILYMAPRLGRDPGKVKLAALLFLIDFEAYRDLGQSITGTPYFKGFVPRPRRSLIVAVLHGWRMGSIEHRLRSGKFDRFDAAWLARYWRDGVPV